jgi:hypothetical protein
MKIIYLATAMSMNGDQVQEDAYTDAEVAMERAKKMCEDINAHTDMKVQPDVLPITLYEEGDVIPTAPPLGSE